MPRELQLLEADLQALRNRPELRKLVDRTGRIDFSRLDLADLASLLADPTASLLLMAAADLNRTALRSGIEQSHAQLVAPVLRRAFVVQSKLPPTADFNALVGLALQRRAGTLGRNSSATTETLFRDRLAFEGLPIRMKGGYTSGLLITRRKPDGVYPDPDTGLAPRLCLEVKKVNRPRDDIQKRLYEIAEVSMELKFLYGSSLADEIDECLAFLSEIAPPGED